MKHTNRLQLISLFLIAGFLFASTSAFSQTSEKQKDMIADTKEAKADFIKTDGLMSALFNKAFAYAIFPNVGKGGLGVGGAFGNGEVYQNGKRIGTAKLSQITVGLQAGGQAYREVIFFETEKDLERFKGNKLEFSAQTSAVAVKDGASGTAKYSDGVMIFTQTKGGLMYEASIGGQTFKFEKL